MPGYVWYSHEVGVKVNAWTITDEDTARWAASLGVDAIITNLPDQAADALRYQRYHHAG